MNVSQQNSDGTWSPAVPLPLYAGPFLKICSGSSCRRGFFRQASYRKHYLKRHA